MKYSSPKAKPLLVVLKHCTQPTKSESWLSKQSAEKPGNLIVNSSFYNFNLYRSNIYEGQYK